MTKTHTPALTCSVYVWRHTSTSSSYWQCHVTLTPVNIWSSRSVCLCLSLAVWHAVYVTDDVTLPLTNDEQIDRQRPSSCVRDLWKHRCLTVWHIVQSPTSPRTRCICMRIIACRSDMMEWWAWWLMAMIRRRLYLLEPLNISKNSTHKQTARRLATATLVQWPWPWPLTS